ncbi:hypothetical protein XA68_11531 [Ophiocordyceps unilateralis]|uniref:Vacuolar protein-sorting-associated protein 36 n=1 Tax=Ophiocordyceps unilateralis TaxID=268505 RepID=A0A2A9PGP1_OPHUN|nr:hypothetical protein XA68_11531 [Ophiocordyceps unilateralis]
MFLKHIDLTTALRPSYLPDEVLLFVQDNVGLYEGKLKLPDQQNGQVYLTSHRICYVDKNEPRANSLALELKHIDRFELYAGFLKSSAKITLIPKPLKRSSLDPRVKLEAASLSRISSASPGLRDGVFRPPSVPPPLTTATWVCTICSFSNPTPVNFDPSVANAYTPLPPCLACGIKPTLSHVLKAAISNASNRSSPVPALASSPALVARSKASDLALQAAGSDLSIQTAGSRGVPLSGTDATTAFKCPRCTFSNHPSLLSCEMCGASLLSQPISLLEQDQAARTQSPGPVREHKGTAASAGIDASEGIKISFRSGGDKIFHERLKGAMTQRKWLLQGAPPVPRGSRRVDDGNADDSSDATPGGKLKTAGIAGLEQLGLNMRKNTELLIGSAFEDLEALMSSAKEVVALAERLARQNSGANGGASAEEYAILAESASQLGLVTTKDMVGGGGGSESLYLSELSRNVAEFLSDDSRGVLKRAGGIITLVDLWAMFNRARGGVELVSPMDFEKAARLWETLRLPVRLRTFRSGVMVVQSHDRTDETTIRALLAWLQDLHEFPPERETPWDWREFGRGVTAQEAAERFGWSIGVADEELLMAEEHGALCRDEGLEGLKFWQNYIDSGEGVPPKSQASQDEEAILTALKESGLY